MADDSEWIQETYDFHPSDTPRGMLYYKLTELTKDQQIHLNEHKLDIIRSNHMYLKDHPEVKIITSTLLRGVLKARPKHNIHKFFADCLRLNWYDLKKQVEVVVAEREKRLALERERLATLAYLKSLYQEEQVEEEEEIPVKLSIPEIVEVVHDDLSPEAICRGILDDIVDNLDIREKHTVQLQVVEDDIIEAKSESDVELDLNTMTQFDSDDNFDQAE